ncbi:FKBP12-associated protein 1 like [Schistosoma japonicum]|nr:FKBP12-associated protein 1 like [Schistosoma japonicum]KAH8870360.1 FKBP12-associated protein 1 like [Schistosoma japonicum]KAH8870361.1 FKBP12-associated protein 1 like [Schistosoma japonicum]
MNSDVRSNQRQFRGRYSRHVNGSSRHLPRPVTSTYSYRYPNSVTSNCNNGSGHIHYGHHRYPYWRNNQHMTDSDPFISLEENSNHQSDTPCLRSEFDNHQINRVVAPSGSSTNANHSVQSTYPTQNCFSDRDISKSIRQQPTPSLELNCEFKNNDNLRSNLIDGLRNSTYECMICISKIRVTDSVWSCTTCYHIYHLSCIRSWVKKSSQEHNIDSNSNRIWRCPSCQTNYDLSPQLISYQCFCGRTQNPEFHPARMTIPHGCDQVCGKVKRPTFASGLFDYQCTHLCTELCHPGPCPPCLATVTLSCPCGKSRRSGTCGDPSLQPCGQICGRQLSSDCMTSFHMCLLRCHNGPCGPCQWIIQTACFCGQDNVNLTCGSNEMQKCILSPEDLQTLRKAFIELQSSDIFKLQLLSITDDLPNREADSNHRFSPHQLSNHDISDINSTKTVGDNDKQLIPPNLLLVKIGPTFSCNRICNRQLSCNNHKCSNYCHSGECPPCALDPKWCLTCPCGKTPLSKLVSTGSLYGDRESCTDPLPTCPNVCGRPRSLCGHPCSESCHSGTCPPCKLSVSLTCRCGQSSKVISCEEFSQMSDKNGVPELCCQRVCKKKLVCGRHKCKTICCNDTIHSCPEICGRRLSCHLHYCEEQCHSGPCNSCWRGVIYSELVCRCGLTVLDPPQPCGSSPPECSQPCSLTHSCDHPVKHTCHMEPKCPPCTVIMNKVCPGGHGVQFKVPCFQEVRSCGRICQKPLPGCSHLCQRKCHAGPCFDSTLSNDDCSTAVCNQPCQKPRPGCGHPCGLPCHEVENRSCLEAHTSLEDQLLCTVLVDVVCRCGKLKQSLPCHQVYAKQLLLLEYERNTGGTSLSDNINPLFTGYNSQKPIPLLPCDNSCKGIVESHNATNQYADTSTWKRGSVNVYDTLLSNLNVNDENNDDNDESPFNPPDYSDHLKQFAIKNFAFVVSIEEQLKSMIIEFLKTNIEPLDSNNPKEYPRVLTHHFPPMNKRKRRFIHDIVEYYGMEAFTCDPEPNCHVMVIARRGYSKLPCGLTNNRGSLTSILKREFPGIVKLSKEQSQKDHKTSCNILPVSNISTLSYAQILRGKPSE